MRARTGKAMGAFLLARISEDEAAINLRKTDDPFLPYGQHWSEVPFPTASAAYSLAELAAKRRITERCLQWIVADQGYPHQTGLRLAAEDVLQDLVQPYATHPTFDPNWRTKDGR